MNLLISTVKHVMFGYGFWTWLLYALLVTSTLYFLLYAGEFGGLGFAPYIPYVAGAVAEGVRRRNKTEQFREQVLSALSAQSGGAPVPQSGA